MSELAATPFDEGGDDSPSLEIAPTPEPAPQPALSVLEGGKPEAEQKAEKPADDYETKYNNLQAALREERAEKARQRDELAAMRSQMEQFKQLREELDAQRRAKKEQEEAERFQQDPAAYLRERIDSVAQQTQEIAQKTERETAEQAEQTRFYTTIASHVQAFQRENPDYNDALQFAYAKRMGEYEIMGIPPEYREQQFAQESIELSKMALSQGVNPAERVYKLAQAWGYSRKAEAPKNDAQTQVERMANGQFAAKTLSKPGTTGEESMLRKVEDMDDDEFDKFWNTEIKPKRR